MVYPKRENIFQRFFYPHCHFSIVIVHFNFSTDLFNLHFRGEVCGGGYYEGVKKREKMLLWAAVDLELCLVSLMFSVESLNVGRQVV